MAEITFKRIGPTAVKKEPPKEEPGSKHPVIAGGLRVGGSIISSLLAPELGLGTLGAMGVGAASELLAQAAEGSLGKDSLKRAAVEAGISAVPGGALVKHGKLATSIAKSGAMSGVGEGMREKAKGEELSPKSIGTATVLGGLTGGVFGKFLPGAVKDSAASAPVVKKTLQDLVTDHAAKLDTPEGADIAAFAKEAGEVIMREGWSLDRVAKEAKALMDSGQAELADKLREAALHTKQWQGKRLEEEIARLESLGLTDDAQHLRRASARTSMGTSKIYNRSSSIDQAAAKEAAAKAESGKRADAARTKAEDLAKNGKVKPSATISEGGVDPVTGERVKYSEKITPAKAKKGGGGDDDDVLGDPSSERPRGGPKVSATQKPAPTLEQALKGLLDVTPAELAAMDAAATGAAGASATADNAEKAFQAWRQSVGLPDTGSVRKQFPWKLLGIERTPQRPTSGALLGAVKPQQGLQVAPEGPEVVPQGVDPVQSLEAQFPARETSTGQQQLEDNIRRNFDLTPPGLPTLEILPSGLILGAEAPTPPAKTPIQQSIERLDAEALESMNTPPSGRAAKDIAEGRVVQQPLPEGITDRRHQELLAKLGGRAPVAPEAPPAARVQPEQPTTPPISEVTDSSNSRIVPVPTTAAEQLQSENYQRRLQAIQTNTPVPPPTQPDAPTTPPVTVPKPLPRTQLDPSATQRAGKVNVQNVLTGEERVAIVDEVIRKAYPEELASKLAPLSQRYQELTEQIEKLGKPQPGSVEAGTLATLKQQKGTVGMEMGLLTRQAEASGVIPPGSGAATTAAIKEALSNANAEKFAADIPIVAGKAEPPSKTPIFAMEPPTEGPQLPVGSKVGNEDLGGLDLSYNPQAAIESQVMRATANQDASGLPIAPDVPPEGGITLGMGLGGFQSIIEKNPQLAARLGMGAVGAVAGGVTDPLDDPLLSMVMGAGLGMAAPDVVRSIRQMGVSPEEVPEVTQLLQKNNPEETASFGQAIWHLLPHIQRFNYLASFPGLASNAIAGPYGSLFFGALAKGLSGDPRGWAAIRSAGPGNWAKAFQAGRNTAVSRIENAAAGDPMIRAEIHGAGLAALPETARKALQVPAVAMAAGDEASRSILMKAGFTEEEAREMTLTSELYIPLFEKLANLARGKSSTTMGLIFPFVRTPLNIVEQGLTRTPFVGFKAQAIREANGATKMGLGAQSAQQALGLVMGFAGFAIGAAVPPEQANMARRFVTNAAGPYSALVAVGFAAGQAQSRGQQGIMPVMYEAAGTLPLPTTQTFTDAGKLGDKIIQGEDLSMTDVPRGMIPAFGREPFPFGLGSESQPMEPQFQAPDISGPNPSALRFQRIK